jgi:hypothetical protein
MRTEPRLRALCWWTALAVIAATTAGCAMSQKTVVKPGRTPAALQTATKAELIERYDQLAASITSLNAGVTLKLTAGSAYTGIIEQYHEVTGFILAQKPSDIRVIGQAPVVGTDIFDMESDGKTFHIFIPSKNQFLTGPANLEKTSAKPIENLRPQHLINAIFWEPIPREDPVLLEETALPTASYYVLTVARPAVPSAPESAGAAPASADWELASKIWFDRADLDLARIQIFDTGGKLSSDVQYSGWDNFGTVRYPRQILLSRPQGDYQLQIGITKLTTNEPIPPERFVLRQPAGTRLVRVGSEPQP